MALTVPANNDAAARIRRLRSDLGLSQAQVAAACGFGQPRIATYEGRHLPLTPRMEARIVQGIREAFAANEHPAGADPSTAPGRTPQAGGKTLADFSGDADAFFAWLGGE